MVHARSAFAAGTFRSVVVTTTTLNDDDGDVDDNDDTYTRFATIAMMLQKRNV